MSGRLRRALISSFVVFHVSALGWWHVGVMEYSPRPREDDAWRRIRAAVASVDPSGAVRDVLREYVRFTALWQLWIMFGPNAPKETSLLEIRGIERYEPGGARVYDPVPILRVDEVTPLDNSRRIGLQPCSFRLDDETRWAYVRGAYAHYHLERAEQARGKRYAGVELVCYIRRLPPPQHPEPDAAPWEQLVIWGGPVVRSWRVP